MDRHAVEQIGHDVVAGPVVELDVDLDVVPAGEVRRDRDGSGEGPIGVHVERLEADHASTATEKSDEALPAAVAVVRREGRARVVLEHSRCRHEVEREDEAVADDRRVGASRRALADEQARPRSEHLVAERSARDLVVDLEHVVAAAERDHLLEVRTGDPPAALAVDRAEGKAVEVG